jgi:oligopeptide/dipeptide ABC transporter ATP-binding protein
MEPLLQVRDLSISYWSDRGQELRITDAVSFDITVGQVVGLLGESGCGKTSIALSLLGLLPPKARVVCGSVHFRGQDILTLGEQQLQKIRGALVSIIFQEPGMALNPVMRVGDQIAEVIRAHRKWNRRRCREEAEDVLHQVRLSDGARIYSAYPHQLSGGQRQRVVIAQALACKPALVIADEPTSALDTTTQAEILALLRELKERLQLALLLITHNPAILMGLADRVLVMYAGRIVEEGGLPQLYGRPLHPYTQGLLRSIPPPLRQNFSVHKQRLPAIAGSPPDLARLPLGCPFEPRCPDRMAVCATRDPEEAQTENRGRVRCLKYGN